jgi:hypothetical protein
MAGWLENPPCRMYWNVPSGHSKVQSFLKSECFTVPCSVLDRTRPQLRQVNIDVLMMMELNMDDDGIYTENAVSPFYYSMGEGTERLAERKTFLYRFGFELNRTVSNSCGNEWSGPGLHWT